MCNKKSVPFLVTETAFAYKYHSSALQVVECCMRALLLLASIIVLMICRLIGYGILLEYLSLQSSNYPSH